MVWTVDRKQNNNIIIIIIINIPKNRYDKDANKNIINNNNRITE